MNGMFNTFEAARQGVAGAMVPVAQGMMAGQQEALKLQQATAKAEESRYRWDEEMRLKKDKVSLQKARDRAQADYLKAQETKWKAEATQGKLPSAVRTQQWVQRTLANPDAPQADIAAAKQLQVNTAKPIKDLPSKNFMSFVDKRLAPKKFGNQVLKNDMDPAQYGDFIGEVGLLAHQFKSEDTKLTMQQAVDKAFNMTTPMLREQSWWERGADIEFRAGQAAGSPTSFASIAEAEQANLPPGTTIMINGRKAVVK